MCYHIGNLYQIHQWITIIRVLKADDSQEEKNKFADSIFEYKVDIRDIGIWQLEIEFSFAESRCP